MSEIQHSDRGFKYLSTLTDTRGGELRVKQSSQAVCEGDDVQSGYVWLFVKDVAHNHGAVVEAAAHMSHEQARELAKMLTTLVDAVEKDWGA